MPKNDDAPDVEGIQPEDSLAQAAYRVLRHQFRRLREEEPGTRGRRAGTPSRHAGGHPPAARRRCGRSTPCCLERATERFLNEFRWLGNALGQVRDLDVYLRLLSDPAGVSEEAAAGLAEYRGEIQQQRNQACTRMLLRAEQRPLPTVVGCLRAIPVRGPPSRGRRTLRGGGRPGALSAALRRARRLGGRLDATSSETALHRLRIRCKRLRYLCEFFSSVYGEPADELAQAATVIQDSPGRSSRRRRWSDPPRQLRREAYQPRPTEVRRLPALRRANGLALRPRRGGLGRLHPGVETLDRPQTFRPLKVEMKQRAKRA